MITAHIDRDPRRTPIRRRLTMPAAVAGAAAMMLAAAAAPAPAAQTRDAVAPDPVLVNPSFEEVAGDDGIPGWAPLAAARPGTSFQVTDAVAHDGAHSLALVDDSATYSVGVESAPFEVDPGARTRPRR